LLINVFFLIFKIIDKATNYFTLFIVLTVFVLIIVFLFKKMSLFINRKMNDLLHASYLKAVRIKKTIYRDK